MILCKPFDKGRFVDFDYSNGSVIPCESANSQKGNLHIVDGNAVAIYSLDNKLMLQIGLKIWDLSSDVLKLNYFHNIANRTSCFQVLFNGELTSIEYEAWWANIPDFEPVEPEMDEDEDFMAYVFSVWKNTQVQKALLSRWN